MSAPVATRRVGRRVGTAAAAVLVLLAGYLAVVGVLRSRPLVLPAPGGPHPVGRVITTVPGAAGPQAAWLWYPARASAAAPAEYVPPGWHGSLPPTAGLGWLLQDVGAVRGHAVADAPPLPGPQPWPVVVLAPGFQSAPWMYTTLGEELASRGHVVALAVPETTPARVVAGRPLTTPDAAQPDPARAEALAAAQAADLRALLTALPTVAGPGGLVDPGRAVLAGHSLGGTAAVVACAAEPRCAGAVDLDGPLPRSGAGGRPVLVVGADGSCAAVDPCTADGLPPGWPEWLRAGRAATAPRWTATVAGAGHSAFGDPVHYFVAAPFGALAGTGTIAPDRMAAVVAAVLAAAAEHLLRGGPDTLLREGSPALPELRPTG